MNKLTSHQITALLAEKHKEDVFVTECKDGPSYSTGMLRLDGWAMKKSWSNPCVTGYEIKVSRADYARDDKWHGYLGYCNEFYFVTPFGLLDPSEVPAPAGLMVVSSTGTILYKKKKASRRDIMIPDTIFRYILFSRAKISRHELGGKTREYWEKWLEHRQVDREFGWNVGGKAAKALRDKIEAVQKESAEIKKEMKSYDDVRTFLSSIDITPDRYGISTWEVRNRIEELRRVIPKGLQSSLGNLLGSLNGFSAEIKALENKQNTVAAEVEDT